MIIGLHLLEGYLVGIAGIQHQTLGHGEGERASVERQRAELTEAMFAAALDFLTQRIDIVAPHLTGDILANTLATGDLLHDGVVTRGNRTEHDIACRGIIDTGVGVVAGTLFHTLKGANLGQFHFLSLLQQFND